MLRFGDKGYIAPSIAAVDCDLSKDLLIAMAKDPGEEYPKRIAAFLKLCQMRDPDSTREVLWCFLDSPVLEIRHYAYIAIATASRDSALDSGFGLGSGGRQQGVLLACRESFSPLLQSAYRARIELGDIGVIDDIEKGLEESTGYARLGFQRLKAIYWQGRESAGDFESPVAP